MPCYNPMIRYETNERYKGVDGKLHFKAYIEKGEETNLYQLRNRPNILKAELIPCGKCIGCRLEYSRQWANRGYLESKCWKDNWFCTITYDDEHLFTPEQVDLNGAILPKQDDWKGCLVKKDLTQFMKNLRQILTRDKEKHPEKYKDWNGKIRFMACGEYGGEKARPHYHLIIFNMPLRTDDLYNPRIINNEVYYQSHIVEQAWTKGISNISEASWNNIAYTARYITKKINGAGSEEEYDEKGQIKEFFRVSRMPGIGEIYFEKHWREIYKNDEIIIKNKEGSISCQPPKYYDELLKEKDPILYKKIKAKRARKAKENNLIKEEKTSLLQLDQLAIEERSHKERHKKLVRAMEQAN